MRIKLIDKTSYFLFCLAFVVSLVLFKAPQALAYSQSSYYGQSSYYSQTYYQSFYQSTYGVTFNTDVITEQSVYVTGNISKGSGSFVIDHPLDPENKLLYHSFVESPDVKNIYDGVATLDNKGEVVIKLPDYFEVLNREYRYQVKGLNRPAPNLYIKEEVNNNQFTIAGGPANATISWQVTGIRKDPYILANPIINEVEKGPDELVDKGEYLFEGYEGFASKTNSWLNYLSDLFMKVIDWLIFWR